MPLISIFLIISTFAINAPASNTKCTCLSHEEASSPCSTLLTPAGECKASKKRGREGGREREYLYNSTEDVSY